ncbi:MAG TPA: hypothetical protein VGF55_26900 [Gemmataceae bacterium]|jgi:hypothetical protein
MADPPGGFTPYRVSYSGRVQDELTALIARAKAQGRHQPLVTAAQAIDHRLRVYPQFGEPIRDSAVGSGREWISVVPPLVVRYVVYEDRRLVCVVYPVQPLPGSGL